MPEKKPSDFRIETVIGQDGLEAAFDRFSLFVQLFDNMELNIRQLQGQMNNLKYEDNAGTLGFDDKNLELNRIRHAFLSELELFKTALPQYLNTSQPELLLRGVSDQIQIVLEVMGQRLRGYYDIEKSLGDGNSALIFLLKDVFTQRRVVTKVLKVPVLSEEIKNEIRAVSQLKHRNIIKLLGESLDRFPFYIICEYVNGPTLPIVLEKTGPRPASQAVDWLFQLADALSYLRQKKILHSNIRPSKIYIDEEQHMMISPFDIIKAGMSDRTLGKFREDCQYLSPEYLRGDGTPLSFQSMRFSDQFSIGLVAYKLLTGRDLFTGDSVMDIIACRERFFQDKAHKKQVLSEIQDTDLVEMIEKMLEEKPQNRFNDLYDVLLRFRQLSMKRDDDASVLRNSYRRCLAINKEFINEFYTLFLEDMPESDRSHFTNRERQHTMLQMAMDVLIDLDQKEDLFRNILENGKHQRFDVAAYERFMDVFIGLAQKTDHKKWDEATEKAWMEMRDKALAVVRKVLKG
ncbi:MAG: protein kinase [Saprospiraceae bacterium]|nr:protein kinase [Saprospiraceae bacterium]